MKKILTGVTVAVVSVMLAGAAFAAPGAGRGGQAWGGGPGGGRWQAAQQISPEEMAKIQEARAKFLTETLELRKTIAAKRVEMQTFYAQPKKDTAKIKALANELIDLRAQVAKKRNEYMGDYAPFFAGGRGGPRGGRPGPGMGMGGGPGFGPGSCFAPVGPPPDEPPSEN